MISPLLPENESPYLRYRQPEFGGASMTTTDQDGSALFETWKGGLLYTTIRQNDVPFLERYLKITPSIVRHIDSLPTYYDPFYVAVENGSLDALKTLLAHYPTVFSPTQEISFRDRGFLLLNLAAEYAYIEIVQLLLNNQPFYANINERADGYCTAIQSAAESWTMTRYEPFYSQDWVDRKEAIMNLLLDWAACASDGHFPVAEEKTSATVLTLAVKWAGPGLVKRLIQGGADVHARVRNCQHDLGFHSQYGYIDNVTAIFIACVYRNFNTIEILLDYRGDEIDAVDMIRSGDSRAVLESAKRVKNIYRKNLP